MDKCKPCKRCPKGHIVEEVCTRRTDTVCVKEKDKNNSKYPPRIPPKIAPATAATTAQTRNQTTTTKKERWKPTSKRPSNESSKCVQNVESCFFKIVACDRAFSRVTQNSVSRRWESLIHPPPSPTHQVDDLIV